MTYQLEQMDTIWVADQGQHGLKVDMGQQKFVELMRQHAGPNEVADALEHLAAKIRSAG